MWCKVLLGLVWGCVQGCFEIVVKTDLVFSLGGLSVSLRFTLDLFNAGVLFI